MAKKKPCVCEKTDDCGCDAQQSINVAIIEANKILKAKQQARETTKQLELQLDLFEQYNK